ncbi:MAG TPA: thioesterase family protein [Ktedonobacterales bacterium]|nr:thioesterase family protein [Ktedonobacterales bacterium]
MPRSTTRIRVAFVDVDSSQRIHFTAMFRYFELAEHDLMRAIGLPYSRSLLEYKFPRAHLDCDFRSAIVFDDLLDIETTVARVGTTSWTVRFVARQARDGTLAAEGHMVMVALDFATERPIPLPDALRAALAAE